MRSVGVGEIEGVDEKLRKDWMWGRRERGWRLQIDDKECIIRD